jgi:hypothetical protein
VFGVGFGLLLAGVLGQVLDGDHRLDRLPGQGRDRFGGGVEDVDHSRNACSLHSGCVTPV